MQVQPRERRLGGERREERRPPHPVLGNARVITVVSPRWTTASAVGRVGRIVERRPEAQAAAAATAAAARAAAERRRPRDVEADDDAEERRAEHDEGGDRGEPARGGDARELGRVAARGRRRAVEEVDEARRPKVEVAEDGGGRLEGHAERRARAGGDAGVPGVEERGAAARARAASAARRASRRARRGSPRAARRRPRRARRARPSRAPPRAAPRSARGRRRAPRSRRAAAAPRRARLHARPERGLHLLAVRLERAVLRRLALAALEERAHVEEELLVLRRVGDARGGPTSPPPSPSSLRKSQSLGHPLRKRPIQLLRVDFRACRRAPPTTHGGHRRPPPPRRLAREHAGGAAAGALEARRARTVRRRAPSSSACGASRASRRTRRRALGTTRRSGRSR